MKQGEKVQVVEQYIIFWPYVTYPVFTGIFHPEREDNRKEGGDAA